MTVAFLASQRKGERLLARLAPLLLLLACGPAPVPTPPKVKLTYEVTRLLSHPRAEPVEPRNSAIPGIRRGLLAEGWGDESGGPGEAHQPRVLELWDDDNGWLRLRATNMDPPTDTPLLTEARALAVLDWTTRWFDAVPSTPQDRNVEIFVRKP